MEKKRKFLLGAGTMKKTKHRRECLLFVLVQRSATDVRAWKMPQSDHN